MKMHSICQVSSNLQQSRCFLIISCITILSIYIFYLFGSEFINYNQSVEPYSPDETKIRTFEVKTCFLSNSKSIFNQTNDSRNEKIILFEDIFEAKKQPTPDRSIFFIESSCVNNGLAALNGRQACAIESAARWNRHRDVFVLFPSKVGFSEQFSSPIMHSLRSFQNINFRRINFRNYSIGTPAQTFFTKDKIFESEYLVETFSDVLRLLTLFKFGGIYLDTDSVVQQSLDSLPANFAGKETEQVVACGAIGLTSNGLGHKIAGIILKNICENFNPSIYGNTGPQAMTRSLQKVCNVTKVSEMRPEICWGFNVLPEEVFYPIHYSQWERCFDANFTSEVLKRSSKSIAVHFWNKLSSQQPILKDFTNKTLVDRHKEKLIKNKNIQIPIGETAYGIIAKKNCPSTYAAAGDLF